MKTQNIFLAKFAVAAVMIGLFSPSVKVAHTVHTTQLTVSLFKEAEARRSVNRGGNRNINFSFWDWCCYRVHYCCCNNAKGL